MTKEYIYLVTDEIQLAPICEDCGPNAVPIMRKEEIVRCRDCRYFGNKVRVGDTFVCNKHGIYVPKDGFCSEGKAK